MYFYMQSESRGQILDKNRGQILDKNLVHFLIHFLPNFEKKNIPNLRPKKSTGWPKTAAAVSKTVPKNPHKSTPNRTPEIASKYSSKTHLKNKPWSIPKQPHKWAPNLPVKRGSQESQNNT